MFNARRLFAYLATGTMPEMTALDESLAEHDKKYHPDGYKDGDSCKFREERSRDDAVDKLKTEGISDDAADMAGRLLKWIPNITVKAVTQDDVEREIANRRGDVGDSSLRFSIVGDKAIPAHLVKEAAAMQDEGKSREEIFDKIGLWKGRDGEWRMEVPDLTTKTVREIRSFMEEAGGTIPASKEDRRRIGRYHWFGNVVDSLSYDDPLSKLSRMYPRLRDITIALYDGSETPNGYTGVSIIAQKDGERMGKRHKEGQVVAIELGGKQSDQYLRRVLVHELQHFIQGEQGWQNGTVWKTTPWQQLRGDEAQTAYENNAGEVEARVAAVRSRPAREGTYRGRHLYPWETEAKVLERNKEIQAKRKIKARSGKVEGWYDRDDGSVALVKGKADANTVAHEIGWHATFHWAEKHHPELYRKLVKYAEEAPEGIGQSVREKYGTNLTPNELLDEIGAERFTREDISPLLDAAKKQAANQFFDRVETAQDETRQAFVEGHQVLTNQELDRIAAMEPKEAVRQLVKMMLEGRTIESPDDEDGDVRLKATKESNEPNRSQKSDTIRGQTSEI